MRTDWLATAKASQSKDFRDKNPHLFSPDDTGRRLASDAAIVDRIKSEQPPTKKGKRRKEMNKTEARFAALLDARVARGEIISWAYEEITLRWPDGMMYTPDFVVYIQSISPMSPIGKHRYTRTALIEVKGAHAWAKDVVKFRAARDKWGGRYKFEFWQEVDGEWRETR